MLFGVKMIGSFITRVLLLIFGYAYPAYECYKSVEMNKPDIEQLRYWCQYWILVAGLTVCERFCDMFIGWVPMYGEAKLAFFVYLWFPKTKGTTYVYGSFFRPYVAKHETEIDRSLLEMRTRAGDMAFLYWQKAASYGQTRVFDVLQYIASQSSTRRPVQQSQAGTRVQKPEEPSTHKSYSTTQSQDGQLSSPASSSTDSENHDELMNDVETSEDSEVVPTPAAALNEHKTTLAVVESIKTSSSHEEQVPVINSTSSELNVSAQSPPQGIVMEEPRATRLRSRKTRTASNP